MRLVVCGILSTLALAQDYAPLSYLAAGPNGSYVLFQSRFGLKGQNNAGREKIFRWDPAGGVRVEVEIPDADVTNPQLSTDGTVFAYTIKGGDTVFRVPTGFGEFRRPGVWRLSANGAWALNTESRRRLNLATNQEVTFDCGRTQVYAGRHAVLNDGRVFCAGTSPSFWTPERREPIPLQTMSEAVATDPSGQTLAVMIASFVWSARDIATGRPLCGGGYPLAIPDADTWLIQASWPSRYHPPQLFRIDLRTCSRERLTDLTEGVVHVSVSGPRTFVSTGVRLGVVAQGDWQEIIPRTPEIHGFNPVNDFLASPSNQTVPGSYQRLVGAGLMTGYGTDGGDTYREETESVRLRLGTVWQKVGSVSPGAIDFQVPWSQPLGRQLVQFPPNLSPLEDRPFYAEVVERAPVLLGYRNQSFDNTSARRGEFLNAFFTGLGAVTDPPESGAALFVSKLSPLVRAFPCRWQGRILESPYAGLAPGLVGVYQVVLKLPTDIPPELREITIDCSGAPVRVELPQ